MELENILCEVTQTQNDMHDMYSLISFLKKVQNTQDTVHRTQKVQQAEVPTWEGEESNHKCGGRDGSGRESGWGESRGERGT